MEPTTMVIIPLEEYEVLIIKERMLREVEQAYQEGTLDKLGRVLFPEKSLYTVGPKDLHI